MNAHALGPVVVIFDDCEIARSRRCHIIYQVVVFVELFIIFLKERTTAVSLHRDAARVSGLVVAEVAEQGHQLLAEEPLHVRLVVSSRDHGGAVPVVLPVAPPTPSNDRVDDLDISVLLR